MVLLNDDDEDEYSLPIDDSKSEEFEERPSVRQKNARLNTIKEKHLPKAKHQHTTITPKERESFILSRKLSEQPNKLQLKSVISSRHLSPFTNQKYTMSAKHRNNSLPNLVISQKGHSDMKRRSNAGLSHQNSSTPLNSDLQFSNKKT